MHKMIYLNLTITVVFLFLLISLNEVYSQSEQQQPSNSPIELTAKLVDNEYRWISSNNTINPTLNITSGVDNQIDIKSIQGDPEEHELIIEGISAGDEEGEELVASEHVEDGSSTTVNFNPADTQEGNSNYQSLEYYCEYHPDTNMD